MTLNIIKRKAQDTLLRPDEKIKAIRTASQEVSKMVRTLSISPFARLLVGQSQENGAFHPRLPYKIRYRSKEGDSLLSSTEVKKPEVKREIFKQQREVLNRYVAVGGKVTLHPVRERWRIIGYDEDGTRHVAPKSPVNIEITGTLPNSSESNSVLTLSPAHIVASPQEEKCGVCNV